MKLIYYNLFGFLNKNITKLNKFDLRATRLKLIKLNVNLILIFKEKLKSGFTKKYPYLNKIRSTLIVPKINWSYIHFRVIGHSIS